MKNNINLNNINTYGDLKKALPSTGTGKVPGINQLKQKASVLLRRETGSGIIEIYDNGFFTFEECGSRPTVFGVDRCSWKDTYSDVQTSRHEITTELDPYPWDMILESAGSARLGVNNERRQGYLSDYSLDSLEYLDNIAFSVQPEHEIREQEEEYQLHREKKNLLIAKEYADLRGDQKEIIDMYFIKKMKQEDIADQLGIDRTAVTHRIRTIKKRFRKYL